MSYLDVPTVKNVKAQPSFKGQLRLGKPKDLSTENGSSEGYDTAISIPVERFFRTHVAKAPSASQYVLRSDAGGDGGDGMDGDGHAKRHNPLTKVKNMRQYQVEDKNAPGGKVDVEREALAKGYHYGHTVVPITATDENITKLETFAGLDVLGFVDMREVCLLCHKCSFRN